MSQHTITAFGAASIFVITVLVATPAPAAENVLFILDGSGSMWERVDGQPKIVTAKKVLDEALGKLPPETKIGFMSYGIHRKGDCNDITLISPIGAINAGAIAKQVDAIMPKGDTPIAGALLKAGDAFKDLAGQKMIVLVTDGAEECHGDPCAAAKQLASADVDLHINLVGFNLGNKERGAVQCVPQEARGQYFDAKDTKSLVAAMNTVETQVKAAEAAPVTPPPAPALPPPPPPAAAPPPKTAEHTYGTPIRGGDAFDSAVSLQTGTQYQLNYDQPADRQDFFKINVKGGQELVATITGGVTNGIEVEFENAQRQRIAGAVSAGTRGRSTLTYDVANGGDGSYFVLIESAGYGGHVGPDATFQLALVNQFDANTSFDAGSDESTALSVQPGMYPRNNMNDVDTLDVYKFTAEVGKIYQFKTRPTNDASVMSLSAVDADGNKLGDAQAQNGGAVATLGNLKLVKTGPIFVKVSFNRNYGYPAGDYSFAFGAGDVASPPRPTPRAP